MACTMQCTWTELYGNFLYPRYRPMDFEKEDLMLAHGSGYQGGRKGDTVHRSLRTWGAWYTGSLAELTAVHR